MPSLKELGGEHSRSAPKSGPAKSRGFAAEHLSDAIQRHLLHVEYQPKVPLESKGAEFAVEALCRLDHPQFGTVDPSMFIPIAEKEGLIGQLTDAVVCRAFADLRDWREHGFSVRLALNISPELLRTREWCEQFMSRCREFEIEPERIILEITESSSGATLDVAFDVLTRLHLRGFTLSIDDFGTGFSSLAALYKLPFRELKIDKSFTFDLQKNPDARALIESTIGIAQRLGLRVVAEGVESEEVFRELRLMGCQHAQGYFISKSILPGQVPQFFANWTSLMQNEPIHDLHALPKIAIIQALLSDILNDYGNENEAAGGIPDERAPQRDATLELARKIPGLVLQGEVAAALARCQAAVHRLERDASRGPLKTKILQLRHVLEQELICTEDIQFTGPGGTARLLPRNSVLIGFRAGRKPMDIDLGECGIAGSKATMRLFAQGTDWFLERIGSTANGNSLAGEPLAIATGETIVNVGEAEGHPVVLRLVRPRGNPNAVSIEVVRAGSPYGGKEQPQLRWIAFDGRISLGESSDCALPLAEAGANHAAEIWFDSGFWIAPAFNVRLSIANAPFAEPTPIPAGADLCVGGATVRVEAAAARAAFGDKPDIRTADPIPLRLTSSR